MLHFALILGEDFVDDFAPTVGMGRRRVKAFAAACRLSADSIDLRPSHITIQIRERSFRDGTFLTDPEPGI
jgi:hypothetical protein